MRESLIHSGMKYQIHLGGSSGNFSELAKVPKILMSGVKISGDQEGGAKRKSAFLTRRFSFFAADRYNSILSPLCFDPSL